MNDVKSGHVQGIRRAVGTRVAKYLPKPLSRRILLLTAAIAALALVLGAKHPFVLICGLFLVGGVWLSELLRAVTSSPSWLASHAATSRNYMILLLIGVGGIYSARTNESSWLVWLSMLLLAVAVSLVSLQSGLLRTKPLNAANFKHNPVIVGLPRVQVRGLLRFLWISFIAHVILAVLARSFSAWGICLLSVMSLLFVAWYLFRAWVWADRARWRTLRELRRIKPIVMMPYGGSAAFHIPMWEEYVRDIGVPYFIFTLRGRTVDGLAEITNAPIVCPSELSSEEVDLITPRSVQVSFYVHNSTDNSVFLQNRSIKSVWIHHGDGDKIASYRAKSGEYDYLFVAGQGAIDRYANHGVDIPPDKFRIIGRPQTISIDVENRRIGEIYQPTVLYAPTWHGKKPIENYSSLEFGEEIVIALISRDVNVIFRPHPASKSSSVYRTHIERIQEVLSHDASRTHRRHIWGEQAEATWSVAEAANASDAMVSDVSGIVTDYMHSKKPYAMVTLKTTKEEFEKEFPTSRAAYVITREDGSLDSALDDMLGSDSLVEERRRARTYYLGGFEGRESAERFVIESRALLSSDSEE